LSGRNLVLAAYSEPELPGWPYFTSNFEKFAHFLTALAMTKRLRPYSKIWPFFQFVIVELSFHWIFIGLLLSLVLLLYFLDGIQVTHFVTVTPWHFNLLLLWSV